MKLNIKIIYPLFFTAITFLLFLIFHGPSAFFFVPAYLSYILFDRITQKLYKKKFLFYPAEIIFSAAYAVYSSLCIVGWKDPAYIIPVFLLMAVWGIFLKRSIYSDDNTKRRLSFLAVHQRNYIFFIICLVNQELFNGIIKDFLILSFLIMLYDNFIPKSEMMQRGADFEKPEELIVYADIREFSYCPGFLKKASLRFYPILKSKLKAKSEDKSLVVINYEKYRCCNLVYDNALKKSILIYCDNFELFAKGSEAVLCGIARNFSSKGYEVFFIADNTKKKHSGRIYKRLVQTIGEHAVVIDSGDIPVNMTLSDYLSEKKALNKISVPEAKPSLDKVKSEPAKKKGLAQSIKAVYEDAMAELQENENTVISANAAYDNVYIPSPAQQSTKKRKSGRAFFKKRPKPQNRVVVIRTPFLPGLTIFAALFRFPIADIFVNFLLKRLVKKRDSQLYGAVKKFYNYYFYIIYIMVIIVYMFGSIFMLFLLVELFCGEEKIINVPLQIILLLIYFVINPLLYLAAVGLYFVCVHPMPDRNMSGEVNYKKLIINMDISDIMKITYMAVPSYYTEVSRLRSEGTEYIKLQNDIISVDYSYYKAHETLLSQIEEKSVIIHAQNNYEYYASFKGFDLCREIEALSAQNMRVFIHTDYPETYPDLKSCVLIFGGYFECIKSVMTSSDHAAEDTIDLAQRYCTLLFSAAQSRFDLFSAEHRTLYYQIEQLKQHYSMLEIFYEYMQTAELFMHYASLSAAASSERSEAYFSELSLGKMTEIISKEKRFFSSSVYGIPPEDKERDRQIRTELQRAEDFFTNSIGIKITTKRHLFRYAFDLIVQIRNRYLGHGSLVYYVSDEMLCAFIPLASAVIAECMEIISSEGHAGKLSDTVLPGSNEPPIVRYMNSLYLYSKRIEKGTEYIDPITGSFYRTYTTETISLKWNENARERV